MASSRRAASSSNCSPVLMLIPPHQGLTERMRIVRCGPGPSFWAGYPLLVRKAPPSSADLVKRAQRALGSESQPVVCVAPSDSTVTQVRWLVSYSVRLTAPEGRLSKLANLSLLPDRTRSVVSEAVRFIPRIFRIMAVRGRRPSAFQAGHIPSWRGSSERYALSPVAAGSRGLLLLLSAEDRPGS